MLYGPLAGMFKMPYCGGVGGGGEREVEEYCNQGFGIKHTLIKKKLEFKCSF